MDKTYADTVRLLLAVAPDVFANDIFATKGGTAINLFVRDMPRLSVDIDVVYLPWQTPRDRSEEHTSELQSLMRISYAVFCLQNKKTLYSHQSEHTTSKYQYNTPPY